MNDDTGQTADAEQAAPVTEDNDIREDTTEDNPGGDSGVPADGAAGDTSEQDTVGDDLEAQDPTETGFVDEPDSPQERENPLTAGGRVDEDGVPNTARNV